MKDATGNVLSVGDKVVNAKGEVGKLLVNPVTDTVEVYMMYSLRKGSDENDTPCYGKSIRLVGGGVQLLKL